MLITTPFRSSPNAARVRRAIPPNPIYVDTVIGSAGGTGAEGSPVNSLTLAYALCAGLPDWEIRVTAPANNPLRAEFVYESTRELLIEGNGAPFHTFGGENIPAGAVWTKTGDIYSRALVATSVDPLVVTTLTETIAGQVFPVKLIKNTATPTTPGIGQFGHNGTVLYVRMPGDVNPDLHDFEYGRRNTCLTTKGFGRLTVRDAVAKYALVAPILNGQFGQPLGTGNLTVEDSTVGFASVGLGAAGQNENTIATRVNAHRCANDGFNLHALAGNGVMILNDCDGSYNGDVAGTSSQGASNHESSHLIVNGGIFTHNVSGGMVAIENATADLHGDTPYGPILIDQNMRLGNTAGTIASQASCAWLDTAHGTVSGAVTVSNGQGVGVRVSTPGAVTGLSNIVRAGNALGDIIA